MMGLDMTVWAESKQINSDAEKNIREIAYWRKHPALHNYLFSNFSGDASDDNVTPILLDKEMVEKILVDISKDVYSKNSPEGFFWGRSHQFDEPEYVEQKADDLSQFKKVLTELAEPDADDVFYEAWY